MYKNYTHVKTKQGRVFSKLWELTKYSLLAAVVSFPAYESAASAAERTSFSIGQDQQTVSGTVLDAENKPLAGVSIAVKGKAGSGTTTDLNGRFSINASSNDVLVFSMVGYAATERTLQTDQTNLTVSLAELVSSLDDVVVVGFGTQKKSNLTGSVAIIDSKSLEARPVRNAIQALQGLAPGLNISQNNGSLESDPAINVRGNGTIGKSSSAPLVLIDGSEGSLTALNPQDIESVSILKYAGASSIYGSRAAFGVILVTTKSGKAGVTSVNYNNSLRFNAPALMPKMMDSYTFAQYFNQAEVNGNGAPHFTEEHLQRILDYQNGKLKDAIFP